MRIAENKEDIESWVAKLREICEADEGMGWYISNFDYDMIVENLCHAIKVDLNRNIIAWDDDWVVWGEIKYDSFSSKVTYVIEHLVRVEPGSRRASHRARESLCQVAKERGASLHFALNVPDVRPGMTHEKECEIMKKHGYSLLSKCWMRNI